VPALLTQLVRRWRVIVVTPLALAVLTAVAVLIAAPTYEAQASFTAGGPASSSLAGLSNLAALAGGLGLSAGLPAGSTDFSAAALTSQEMARQLLQSRFRDPRSDDPDSTLPLLDILRVRGDSERERIHRGYSAVASILRVEVDRRAGIVTLTVRSRWPELAADVANRLVQLLNGFNLRRQQYQSGEQSRFTGERMREAEAELREAEQALQVFLQANRSVANSPLLAFQQERLQRRVQLRQEVFLTLAREHEQARIAAERDTPVLAVVDSATAPYWRSAPRRKLSVVLAGVLGTFLAIGAVFAMEHLRGARTAASSDWADFYAAGAIALGEIRTLPARLRRRWQSP